MGLIDNILYYLAFVLALILFYGLFIEAKNKKGLFLKSNLVKYTASIGGVIIFAFTVVTLFASEPNLNSAESKIEFGEKYKYYVIQNKGYHELIQNQIENYELNFDFVQGVDRYVKRRFSNTHDLEYIKSSDEHIDVILFYSPYQHVDDVKTRDIGLLFQSLYRINMEGSTNVNSALLGQITNREMPYYHFVVGRHYFNQYSSAVKDSVELHFLRSIEKKEAVSESVEWLCKHYYLHKDYEALNQLVAETESGELAPAYFKRIVYLRNGNFIKYWIAVFKPKLDKMNMFGVFFASLITLMWIVYLRKIDIYEHEKWKHLIAVFVMSCLSLFLIYPYTEILQEFIGFLPGETVGGEFWYEFVNIGLGEEMVKIIPVLIILRVTKAINEPFDYVLYASVSGLGFAFIENFGYLTDSTLSAVNARMLYAAVVHMFLTSIIGYALMLVKYHFKKPKLTWLAFLIGYLLAAFIHTFYDFWLLNFEGEFKQISTVTMLLIIHLWFIMKNNSLNLSTFYTPYIKMDNNFIKYFLIVSILVVFMGSFMLNSFTQGPEYGWYVLDVNFSNYSFFMLYIGLSFSRYSIVKGHLASFVIPSNFLIPQFRPSQINYGDKVMLYNVKVRGVAKKETRFTSLLPLSGTVGEQVVIGGKPGSFLITIDKEIGYEKYSSHQILVQSKERRRRFNEGGKTLVKVLVYYNEVDIESRYLTKSDFRLLGSAILVNE